MVKAYSFMSWLLFFASMASAGLALYSVYSEKNITGDCISTDNQGNVSIDNCSTHVSTGVKIVVTVLVVLMVLTHLCACLVSTV